MARSVDVTIIKGTDGTWYAEWREFAQAPVPRRITLEADQGYLSAPEVVKTGSASDLTGIKSKISGLLDAMDAAS